MFDPAETPSSSSRPAPLGSLAERLAARIRELAPRARVEIVNESQLYVWRNGGSAPDDRWDMFLDNLRKGCADERACDTLIDIQARGVLERHEVAVQLSAVLPTLKPARFVEETEAFFRQKGRPTKLLTTPVVDDLHLVLVEDKPISTRFLTEADLPGIGLTQERLTARALENLRQSHAQFPVRHVALGLFGLDGGDGYDSALFLLHDEWQALASLVKGNLVVAPIGRDMVMFTGDQETDAATTLGMILKEEERKPEVAYPITNAAYRWTPSGWSSVKLLTAP